MASEVHLHPYYRFTPQADRYDVAVVKLDRRVDFEPHIRDDNGGTTVLLTLLFSHVHIIIQGGQATS